MTIDLISWWMLGWAFEFVPPSNVVRVHVLQTELANVQHAIYAVFGRIRRSIPSIDFPAAKIDAFDLTAVVAGLFRLSNRRVWVFLHGLQKTRSPVILGFL